MPHPSEPHRRRLKNRATILKMSVDVTGEEQAADRDNPSSGEQDTLQSMFPRPPPVEMDVQAQRQFHRVGERLFGAAPRPFMLGDWELGEPIGAGGMGVVYPSYDRKLDRRVAIKVLHLDVGADIERKRERMLQEARALAKVRHPHVIGIHAVESSDSHLFLVMELFPGRTLAEWLAAAPRSWPQIIEAFRQAGEGLAALHAVGLVHRDFKPTNVLVDGDGQVRLIDLGLARVIEGADGSESGSSMGAPGLTRDGAFVGTLDYCSPEQLRGEVATDRSDQYSFFRSLYEALYQARAFTGRTPRELLEAMQFERPRFEPNPLRVPVRLRRALGRGLSFHPGRRFPSMSASLAVLAGRSRWWALWSTAAVVATAVSTMMHSAPSSCPDLRTLASQVLPTTRLERIEREAARVGAEATNVGWHHALGRLTSHVQRWASSRAAMCEAGGEAGCLAEHRQRLDAVLDVLETPSLELILHAGRLVRELDEHLTACERGEAKYGEVDPVARGVRSALVRARAKELAGYLRAAELEATAAVEAATRSANDGLRAEAALQLGRVLGRQRRPEARAVLREARALALRGRDLATAADAAIFLRKFTADVLEDPGGAGIDGELAEEMVSAAGGQPLRRADLLDATGILMRTLERFAEAQHAHSAAAELYRSELGEGSLDELRARLGAINAASDREDAEPEATLAAYAAIAREAEAVAGARHPWTGSAYYNASCEAEELGHWDQAERWAGRAWSIAAATQGEDSPEAIHAALVLGRVAHELGRPGTSEFWARTAVGGLEQISAKSGAVPADLQPALELLAELARARGDAEEAARTFERAGAIALKHPLLGPAAYLDEVYNAAVTRCEVGAWLAARDGLEQALRVAPADIVRTTLGGVAVRGQLGVVYASLGERREAEELLSAAIRDGSALEDAAGLISEFADALTALRRR